MSTAHVTRADLIAGFRELGVQAGDLVFVHASLSRFGQVDGAAQALIEALLATIGPVGTLAMPGFTFNIMDLPSPTFDVRHSLCWASRVYELFRTQYATHRSHHLSHSVCACGARAAELTADHGPSPFGPTSPFCKLAQWHGKILLLGVSHNSNTTFHAVEEREQVFYSGVREKTNVTIVDEEGIRRPLPTLLHVCSRRYDFNRTNEGMLREGIQQEGLVGDAVARRLDARRMFDYGVQAVRRDREALLEQRGQRMQIPVGRAKGKAVYG